MLGTSNICVKNWNQWKDGHVRNRYTITVFQSCVAKIYETHFPHKANLRKLYSLNFLKVNLQCENVFLRLVLALRKIWVCSIISLSLKVV